MSGQCSIGYDVIAAGQHWKRENGIFFVFAGVKELVNVMSGESFDRLNRAVGQLIDDFSLVSFLKLDVQDEDSIGAVLSYIDDAIQFHESQEPKEPRDMEPEGDM